MILISRARHVDSIVAKVYCTVPCRGVRALLHCNVSLYRDLRVPVYGTWGAGGLGNGGSG